MMSALEPEPEHASRGEMPWQTQDTHILDELLRSTGLVEESAEGGLRNYRMIDHHCCSTVLKHGVAKVSR